MSSPQVRPLPMAGAGPHMMQDPRVLIATLQQERGRLMQDNARLTAENDGMQMRMKHFTGILIGVIRTHFGGKEFRMPKAAVEIKPELKLGINSKIDPVTEEMVVEVMSQKEFQIMMAGLQIGQFEATVPKKSPFRVQVQLQEGATFEGPELVTYRGGKSDGVELTYVTGKPKKPREFTADKNGVFTFTTDSAGMKVAIQFLIRVKLENTEEEAPTEQPLEFKNDKCRDWHSNPNNGDAIIGRYCPECGDGRKMETAQV